MASGGVRVLFLPLLPIAVAVVLLSSAPLLAVASEPLNPEGKQ
jgi:hypothetical protein